MYTNILIPTDGSELAGKAVQHGIALAKRIGAKVTALTVLLPFHVFTTDTQMIEDPPAQIEYACKSMLGKRSAPSGRQRKRPASPATWSRSSMSIPIERSLKPQLEGCDLIVMASHGRHGISAMVLGSETVKVLTHCKIPVLVHR